MEDCVSIYGNSLVKRVRYYYTQSIIKNKTICDGISIVLCYFPLT